jgi:hypothetical protein
MRIPCVAHSAILGFFLFIFGILAFSLDIFCRRAEGESGGILKNQSGGVLFV